MSTKDMLAKILYRGCVPGITGSQARADELELAGKIFDFLTAADLLTNKCTPGNLEVVIEEIDRSNPHYHLVADGVRVAALEYEPYKETNAKDDAERLARCWNSHGDLLTMLKVMVAEYSRVANGGDVGFFDPERNIHVQMSRAAISKAEKEN